MSPQALYQAYVAELNTARMAAATRAGVLIVIGLNTAFIALDWFAYPDRFLALLATRLLWDAVMGAVYLALRWLDSLVATMAGLVITGIGMLAVIGIAGGVTGSYWPGMMILFLGIPVMLPLSPRQSGLVVGSLLLGFAGLPLLTAETVTLRTYLIPLFFVGGAAIECVVSSKVLETLRLADFRQRRELEAARDHLKEMDSLKARFTANVHHELRTPLTLMLAPVESLLAGDFGDLGTRQRDYLKTVHVNGLRLLKLINNLLDLAKVESQQLTIERRPIQVGRLVEEIVTGARPLADRKRVQIDVAISPDVGLIYADADALEKVFVNLIGNALKFTDESGGVSVEGSAVAEGVEFAVRDSGVGLPESELSRIFDRFAQVDGSTTRRHEGTGIGLSLSKELVELHGGRIWAESEGLGQGATIRFVLPTGVQDTYEEQGGLITDQGQSVSTEVFGSFDAELSPHEADDSRERYADLARTVERWESEQNPEATKMDRGDGRAEILVCDDNQDMRKLLRDVLEREFRVRLACNGREGLDEVHRQVPDLVLTDVMMPEMSGIELCEAIKGDSDTEGVPVVLLTSKAERDMKLEGLEKGADDYVTKPFHARELLARVRSLVRLRRLQEELAEQNDALADANAGLERALRELKEAEAHIVQAERLAAVGELAAGVAHEVNNPVSFARNSVQTLVAQVAEVQSVAASIAALRSVSGDALVREVQKVGRRMEEMDFETLVSDIGELAGIVKQGLDRTGKLVGDLRDFAAPREPARHSIQIVETIESAVQLARYSLQQAGVAVDVVVEGQIPPVVGDPQALGQVFLNLLKNAAEALDSNAGIVRVTVRRTGEQIEVAVEDDGPGVRPEAAGRLFEPFFSTKPAGKGSGLGLSICRNLAAQHGGTIEADLGFSGGGRFVVKVPIEECHGA